MLESIEDVLAAEADAEKLISEAKVTAAQERTAFSETEAGKLRDAQAEIDKSVRERLAAARDEQDRRVNEAQEELRRAEESFATGAKKRIEAAVDAAVTILLGVSDEEGGE